MSRKNTPKSNERGGLGDGGGLGGGGRGETGGGDENGIDFDELITTFLTNKLPWVYSTENPKPYNEKIYLIDKDDQLIFSKNSGVNILSDAIKSGRLDKLKSNYEIVIVPKGGNLKTILANPKFKRPNSNYIGYSMDILT